MAAASPVTCQQRKVLWAVTILASLHGPYVHSPEEHFFPSIAEPANKQISFILEMLGRMLCGDRSLLIVLHFKSGLLLRCLLGSVTTLSSASSAAGFSSCELWSCAGFHAANGEAQG